MSIAMSRPRRAPPRSRAETKEATRAALIAAGLEEFARHGLDASLDRISARANVTRGAFYVHFADRDAFILAVMNHVLGGFVTLLTGVHAEVGVIDRAIELFFAAARARAPALHGGRALRFFHLMDACYRSRELGDAYRGLMLGARDQLAGGVAVEQGAGRVRADLEPAAIADFMMVTALGVVAMLELGLPIDLQRLAGTTRGLLGSRAM
jgi:AcrR family transcriptional regulator